MKKIKISSISLKTTPLRIEENRKKILSVLQDPAVHQSGLVVFPELCISGYGCEDAFYNPHLWKESFTALESLLPSTVGKIVVLGLPVFRSPHLYNCAAVLCDGELVCLIPKTNLANTGIHYEKRWFQDHFEGLGEYNYNGVSIPFGNYLVQFLEFSMGVEICEDSWVSNKPSIHYSKMGADVILSLGASHFSFHKQNTRLQIFKEISRSQNCVFVYSNLNGNEAGKVIFEGGSSVYQNGNLTALGERLFFSDYKITNCVVDLDLVNHNRAKSYRDTNESSSNKLYFPYKLKETSEPISVPMKAPVETIYNSFTDAVTLGLWDYLIKTNSKGFTVSLSGGADSAACAILVEIMKRKAEREVPNLFLEKGIDKQKMLCTIYQGTANNSAETQKAAEALAKELKSVHYNIDITSQVSSIVDTMKSITGINLNWKEHDIPLQNVQARVRSPNVWFLANLFNHLLLSTGNRSEAAVGYTTMDGDSSGSISPLAGVSKEFLLNWLEHVKNGNESIMGKVASLNLILAKRPSAELKPLEETQEDEKDLMPYPLLQKIEYQYIVNGRSAVEILDVLKTSYPNTTEEELSASIKKFITLFKRSQWKRDRLPPSFHLDEYGLDPKYSYRFPILS